MTPTTASRLRSLLSGKASTRNLISFRFASSLSSPNPDSPVVRPRNRTKSVFEDQSDGGGSAAYNHAVRIRLEMWDEMAKVALEHIKPGDYIYVAGYLKALKDFPGNEVWECKVKVNELNFIKQQNCNSHEVQQSNLQGGSSPKHNEDRLHLWQIFFSSPKEWYDWRVNKKTPRSPDFKHKSTSEALWMKTDDPPWIKKQLELHDNMVAAGCFQNPSSNHHQVSSFLSDDVR